jgi:WD40 repeat protein
MFLLPLLLAAPPAAETRLNVFDPAVVLATGGRTAACDALAFTPDGRTLLAVGDDKCVHSWEATATELRYAKPLFWNSFRERRGSLYALSVSADGTLAAAAGFGRLTSDVVVFDLRTGRIAHALSAPLNKDYAAAGSAVWAVAFDPRNPRVALGHEDGSVWLWDYPTRRTAKSCSPAATATCSRRPTLSRGSCSRSPPGRCSR